MAPYPTAEVIKAMFSGSGGLKQSLHPDAKLTVMGHEHSGNPHFQGKDTVDNALFADLGGDWIDWSTLKIDVRHAIGGGESPWAAVEGTTRGSNKKGLPLAHDWVAICKLDEQGFDC